jgi:hypothetical protein
MPVRLVNTVERETARSIASMAFVLTPPFLDRGSASRRASRTRPQPFTQWVS